MVTNMPECSRPGESNGRAMLTEEDVRLIRMLAADGMKTATLVTKFNTTRQHLWRILTNKRWRHVK